MRIARRFCPPYGFFNALPHFASIVRASSGEIADTGGNRSFQANGLTASMMSFECDVTPSSRSTGAMRGSSADDHALRTMSTCSLGSPPMKPPRFHFGLPLRAAGIWSNLEAAGVTDVVGVWQHVAQLMTVVALRQRYDGHAKRAALIAAAQSYMGRVVAVVDDDVDPSDINDVMWAVTTRCEPAEQVDIVRNAWSSALDPRIPPDAKERGITAHSKLIIEAVKPFAWKDRFPPASALSHEDARAIADKWDDVLKRR